MAAVRFTRKEKAQLEARFAENWPLKVWTSGDVATVHIFGGHFYIKKRENGYDWRWRTRRPSGRNGHAAQVQPHRVPRETVG